METKAKLPARCCEDLKRERERERSWTFKAPQFVIFFSVLRKRETRVTNGGMRGEQSRQRNWAWLESVWIPLARRAQRQHRCLLKEGWKGGGKGATRVCLRTDSRGKGCMFRIYLSALCLLLLCIWGRELGSSTKSQEGLLDTRVINFFRVPVASAWILMLLTGLQLYRLSLKYEEALLEAPGVISWRVGANPSPSSAPATPC